MIDMYLDKYGAEEEYSNGGGVGEYKIKENGKIVTLFSIEKIKGDKITIYKGVDSDGKEHYFAIEQYISGSKKHANGGGIEDNFDYGSDLTDEAMVKQNLMNGEISCETLTKIIGCQPSYPYQVVGAIKLEKCYLRPYYKLA
jgi:hypothetical protein